MATQNHDGKRSLKLLLLLGLLAYVALSPLFTYSFSQGPNNRNVSVDTQVNVTQSMPTVLDVIINGGATNITLNAGSTVLILCNASARDYNGGSTLTANATLFHTGVSISSPDDNNTHYTNGSCAATGTSGFFRNFSCSFAVQYYANTSFWNCTVNVTDDYGFTAVGSNRTHIDALLALNVTPLIDFGDLAVGDTSAVQQANVTNLGNQNINVSVQGYGRNFSDGLAMVCEQGNISIEYEKYNITDGGASLGAYFNLSSSLAQVPGLTVLHRTNDSAESRNTTYWVLYVPPNPFGLCNGTVVFQAEQS